MFTNMYIIHMLSIFIYLRQTIHLCYIISLKILMLKNISLTLTLTLEVNVIEVFLVVTSKIFFAYLYHMIVKNINNVCLLLTYFI